MSWGSCSYGSKGYGNTAKGVSETVAYPPTIGTVTSNYDPSPYLSGGVMTYAHDATGASVLLVFVSSAGSGRFATISGITFNGSALTKASSNNNDLTTVYRSLSADAWYIPSPAQGLYNIVISYDNADYGMYASAINIIEGNKDGAASQVYLYGNATNPKTVTVPSSANDVAITLYVAPYEVLTNLADQKDLVALDNGYLRHRIVAKYGSGSTTTLGLDTLGTYDGVLAGISLITPAAPILQDLTGNAGTLGIGSLGNTRFVALTGSGSTLALGSVGKSFSPALVGDVVTPGFGTLAPTGSLALTGLPITTTKGALGLAERSIGVTGNEAVSSLGAPVGFVDHPSTVALTGHKVKTGLGVIRGPGSVVELGTWQRGSGDKTRSDQ